MNVPFIHVGNCIQPQLQTEPRDGEGLAVRRAARDEGRRAGSVSPYFRVVRKIPLQRTRECGMIDGARGVKRPQCAPQTRSPPCQLPSPIRSSAPAIAGFRSSFGSLGSLVLRPRSPPSLLLRVHLQLLVREHGVAGGGAERQKRWPGRVAQGKTLGCGMHPPSFRISREQVKVSFVDKLYLLTAATRDLTAGKVRARGTPSLSAGRRPGPENRADLQLDFV